MADHVNETTWWSRGLTLRSKIPWLMDDSSNSFTVDSNTDQNGDILFSSLGVFFCTVKRVNLKQR